MATFLECATSPQAMNAAWRFYRNDKAHWSKGISRREIEKDLVFHLMTLAEELRQGRYRPARLRRFSILKGDGSKREIAALGLRDKIAQRIVVQALTHIAEKEFHTDSYGYRPVRNVDMACSRVRTFIADGYHWLARTDISQFFDEIPIVPLMGILKRRVSDKALLVLLERWLLCHATRQKRWWCAAKGLPQGAVLSPLLANWYVSDIDHKLSKKGVRFVRFADDIVLCCKTREQAKKSLVLLERQLKKKKLRLSKDKTAIFHASNKVMFLGKNLQQKRLRNCF